MSRLLGMNDESPLIEKNAGDHIEGFDMRFLDNVTRQEQKKNQTSAWSQCVNHLSRFIRQHLRKAEAASPLNHFFIHFDQAEPRQCDNCGHPGVIMHLWVARSDVTINLCKDCFAAAALAFKLAAKKLRIDEYE